ncbi:MAG: BsaWI family type II restriction enzyme, partial [candidate division WOR-3 bacterium]|nr:BsaWI family type II restriction enzyme [candidate division WOR-3 bacterium]
MKFDELLRLYKEYKNKYGEKVFNNISELFREFKSIHKREWDKSPTPNKDHEQSWRAFKGKNLEKLILYIIKEQVEKLGLKIIEGNTLERKRSENLSEELNRVKRNLLIHYGEFGSHLPDVDLIVYNPENFEIIAVISSKVTLRERITQTGYWKLKLSSDAVTKNIKVFFITPDEDGTLTKKIPAKKGRAIVEIDTDGCYVMSDT